MGFDYGFGELGNCLVDECQNANPDFGLVETLISQIHTLNLMDAENEENILSEIILYYPIESQLDDYWESCLDESCDALLDGRQGKCRPLLR